MSLIEDILAALPSMPPKIARAGRYAVDKPEAIALQSMRGVAVEIGVAAPTMQRLAQHLGFGSYDKFREALLEDLLGTGFGYRARALRSAPSQEDGGLLARIGEAAQANIAEALGGCDEALLEQIARVLVDSHHTYVIGSGAVHALADVMVRSGEIVLPGLRLAQTSGATIVEAIRTVDARDAIVLLGIAPYSRRSLAAAEYARARGATIIALTDLRSSPMSALADLALFAPARSPHYYPSMVSLMTLIEALLAKAVAISDESALERIRFFEEVRKDSGGYVGD